MTHTRTCKVCGETLYHDNHRIMPPAADFHGFEEAELPRFDLLSSIAAFESGEIDEDGLVELFQYLVDSGLAWKLQGFYGRTAARMIEDGLIDPGHGQNVEAN